MVKNPHQGSTIEGSVCYTRPRMTLPRSAYYAAEDLSWFSLDYYQSLADYSFGHWRDLIQDRIHLRHIVSQVAGHQEQAETWAKLGWDMPQQDMADADQAHLDALAVRLKERPLEEKDSWIVPTDADSPLVTATIRPLTGDYLQFLGGRAEEQGVLGLDLPVDGVLLFAKHDIPAIADQPRLAHLVVNVDATKKQLVADFECWIDALQAKVGESKTKKSEKKEFKNKDYEKARQEWLDQRVVPYFDLKLIADIEGKKFRDDDLHAKLFPEHNADKWKITKRRLDDWTKEVFSDRTLVMMSHLSFADPEGQ